MALHRSLRPVVHASRLIGTVLVLAAWASLVRAESAMLYGYEDAFGVLRLSDRKLDDRYVAVCPYDDRVRSLDFEFLRQTVRQKTAERKAAAARSPEKFWVSDATTPRLARPGAGNWGGPSLGGRSLPTLDGAAVCDVWRSRRRPVAPSKELLNAINTHCQRRQMDPHLVYAVIEAESNFQPDAVSPKGAQGLMQIMPETGRQLGLQSPFDPERNIEAGVRYLRLMLDRFGSLPQALAAYNAGPGSVEQHGGVPPIPETQQYVGRVMARYQDLKAQEGGLLTTRPLPLLKADVR